MRLALVIPSLERGGAERILAMLAGKWAERGDQVTLMVFSRVEGTEYPLHGRVKLLSIDVPSVQAKNIAQALWRNIQRICRLRRAIGLYQPDVVISFLDFTNIVTALATRGMGIPLIVSERANPDHVPIGAIWNVLRRITYPFAEALVCQTKAMVPLVQKGIKIPGWAIPNPVELPVGFTATKKPSVGQSRPTLVGMGRLVHQKGFDLLLEAFARVANRNPEWSLTIIGTGPLQKQLEEQAGALGLSDRVTFAGLLLDPFPVLSRADLFVFSSRFEGFGNALTEAMACGLPAISFDCPAGPGEIIRDGVDGILVPPENVEALAAAMDELMADKARRQHLAQRAPEVLARFSPERVLPQWDALFDSIVPGRVKPQGAAVEPTSERTVSG
jgi:GalNAc-alpha-(1->4)-GalNAc-alpha-(1->3)-diNAcBac-PP-undecaprenol alpha-1,4-N-acetyl-D-galactosaminyltransferase